MNVSERIEGRESIEGTCPARGVFWETLAHQRACLRDFSTIFLGNWEYEKTALREWLMFTLLDPLLLVRIYITTLNTQTYTWYMEWGTQREYQKVAKSWNNMHTPEKYKCAYIYMCVLKPCALCSLLIHILFHHVEPPLCWSLCCSFSYTSYMHEVFLGQS